MSSFTKKVPSFLTTHQLDGDEDPGEHIRVSSFYEIDHSKLPSRSPEQLLAIRVVMVNEKTRMRVSLRFPSIYSLRAYLMETRSLSLSSSKSIAGNKNSTTDQYCSSKMIPALDMKYIMGSEVAAEVLYRRIPPLELATERCSWLFWAVPPKKKLHDHYTSLSDDLKEPGILQWAHRRQVRFLAKDGDDINQEESIVPVFRSSRGDHVLKGEQEEEEEEDDDEEEEERIDNRKRKCHVGCGSSCCRTQTKKQQMERARSESGDTKKQIVVYKRRNNKVLDRWSSQRYNMAEMNMLKIMKQEGAVFGNPILRHELREKARKLIGDTGLLDHLLKHMAGKVAPGGEERYQRRHNSVGGAMEYWLEKADLDDIRKQVGVKDPYWIPPPGWKPGDDPSQDPVCAREIMQLKDQMAYIKKNMELLISSKHEKEKQLATPSASSQDMEKDSLLIEMVEKYRDLDKRMEKFEDQLMGISQSVCRIQDEMEMLKTTVVESSKTEVEGQSTLTTRSAAQKEGKAAKLERLRSGFKICKPQGTFIWPSMAISSPAVSVQLEDLLAVPTPPSVSSNSAKQSHHLCAPTRLQHENNPTPAVKPLAERKPTTFSPSTAGDSNSAPLGTSHPQLDTTFISFDSTTTLTPNSNSVMNLNEPHLFFF